VTQEKFLECKIKRKLHASNIQWHTANVPIPKEKNRDIERRDGTKSKTKPSRENSKYGSFKSGIQEKW
jgi:hypothetical protein